MLGSNNLITGGTFTLVNSDAYHHRLRGVFLC